MPLLPLCVCMYVCVGSCTYGVVRTFRLVLVVLYNFSTGFKVMFST